MSDVLQQIKLDNCVQDWATMGELPKKEWMESVQLVFDYFCERTPRSFVEARETSVVWNYKYAGKRSCLCLPTQANAFLAP